MHKAILSTRTATHKNSRKDTKAKLDLAVRLFDLYLSTLCVFAAKFRSDNGPNEKRVADELLITDSLITDY